jgi:hypothetical protein
MTQKLRSCPVCILTLAVLGWWLLAALALTRRRATRRAR